METATFGAGCFWCIETIFKSLIGVSAAVSGYAGGTTENPSYKEVCTGTTGHAEVVQITYNPQLISYEELLEVFWQIHDPTTLNKQGADVGTQYRSVIFYHNEKQKETAEKYKQKLNAAGVWNQPIVTEIVSFKKFYKAENYHQDYYNQNQEQPYCSLVIKPKLEKFQKVFKDKVQNKEMKYTKLTPEEEAVIVHKSTEKAFTGKYLNNKEKGTYICKRCKAPLYQSENKFDSHCGWPSFDEEIPGAVKRIPDADGERTEIICTHCSAHLGHVFTGEKFTSKNTRHCVNSISIEFIPAKK